MEKEIFISLPQSATNEVLWAILGDRIEKIEAPRVSNSPKFDTKIRRKGGQFQWASETDANGLKFWIKRAAESLAGPKTEFTEKNEKQKKSLDFFLGWRSQNPTTIWSGERDEKGVRVTAKAPSDKPTVYDFQKRGEQAPARTTTAVSYEDDDNGDVPF